MLNVGGEAELHTDVVMKTKEGAVIAKLGVIGNSKRKSSMSVNGVNTSIVDSLPSRAVHATADEICEYLQTHA